MDDRNNFSAPTLDSAMDDDARRLIELTDRLNGARNIIASIITDIESITLHQNPSIEAEWQVTVGSWENRLLEAQIAMRRAKRKCALAQSYINHDAVVDDEEIESQLDTEFAEWQDKLASAVSGYIQALNIRANTIKIDQTKSQALKEVFRILAKRLHPDINAKLDEEARMMFFLAQSAYKQADLEMLESLEVSTRGKEPKLKVPQTLDEAEIELALALAQVNVLEKRKKDLMADRPYCLLALLRDEEWLESHISKMKKEIEACEKAEADYRERYEQRMEQHG